MSKKKPEETIAAFAKRVGLKEFWNTTDETEKQEKPVIVKSRYTPGKGLGWDDQTT